jgi:hypothetical protein
MGDASESSGCAIETGFRSQAAGTSAGRIGGKGSGGGSGVAVFAEEAAGGINFNNVLQGLRVLVLLMWTDDCSYIPGKFHTWNFFYLFAYKMYLIYAHILHLVA